MSCQLIERQKTYFHCGKRKIVHVERASSEPTLLNALFFHLTDLFITKMSVTNGHEVARWHNKSRGIIGSTAHPAYLQVAEEALADLDDIVVTLVYQYKKEKDDEDETM